MIIPSENAINISDKVVLMWINKLPFLYKFIMQLYILLGDENIKGFIILLDDNTSQDIKNNITIENWINIIILFFIDF